jgi:hypothetical protein
MSLSYRIDPVEAQPQFGNTGPEGWGFTLWCDNRPDYDSIHRSFLERFAAAHPQAVLSLPPYSPGEDCIEGWLEWAGQPVWIWYENILDYLYLWCSDRAAVEELRRLAMKGLDAE